MVTFAQPIVTLAPTAPLSLVVSADNPSQLSLTTGGSGGAVTSVNGQTGAVTVSGLVNPMTSLGDTMYGGASGVVTRLPGDPLAVRKFLRELGDGVNSAPPAWDVLQTGDLPAGVLLGLLAADASVVIGGSASVPNIRTSTLDAIAALHPPAADWSNNSHKITSLANGSAAQDAAAFGQLPVADATAADILGVGSSPLAGGNGKWADSGHVHTDPCWLPADNSFLAWTYDYAMINGGTILGTGVVNLIRVNIRQAISFSNVNLIISSAGSGLTAGQSFAGVISQAGNLIASSADQSGSWNSSGLKSPAMAGGPFTANPPFVWVVVSSVGTTPPTLGRTGNVSAAAANANYAAASARYATNGTATTALPSTIVPGSNVLTAPSYWAALS